MKLYRILLWKAYFEKGYSLSHYLFKLIAVLGLTSNQLKATFVAVGIYSILCLILGRLWWKYKLVDTEIEINNLVNPFVREMRDSIGVPNKRKL